jgi:colanic acid biosynthesis glycosyl transferase WcaI
LAAGRQRPRLLVFNQYYHPGVEATAGLLTELCESMAADWDVTVITGRLHGHEKEEDYERRNGVQIIRVHSTSYDRAPLHRRAANYFTYLARALRRGLAAARPDVVLCMTDPPLVGNVASIVARRFRAPFVIVSQDVFPEIAVRLRRLDQPLLVALLRVLISLPLRRADRVVAIGPVMRERLIAKGSRERCTVTIPNWVDTTTITPRSQDNEWSRARGLAGRFVVMHSGNVGHAQNLEVLVHAATQLDDLDDLSIVVIGEGARHQVISALADRVAPGRVTFLPYQPRSLLSESLSAAAVHYVGLPEGLAGYIVPSRVNGILAVGRPVLAAVDPDGETATLVREADCGVVVAPGDPGAVAEAIRAFSRSRTELVALGANARSYAETHVDRAIALARYRELFDGVRR